MLSRATTLLSPESRTTLGMDESSTTLVKDMAVESSKDGNFTLTYEQYIRAGSFKGSVELQVVRHTKSGCMLYSGAWFHGKMIRTCLFLVQTTSCIEGVHDSFATVSYPTRADM